jgi:hypothetical protein
MESDRMMAFWMNMLSFLVFSKVSVILFQASVSSLVIFLLPYVMTCDDILQVLELDY